MNNTIRTFQDASRYPFDSDICSFKKGWAQVDTSQDASYYGNWANPTTLTLMSYVEGDITKTQADTKEDFVEAVTEMVEWHKGLGYWKGIDCMCDAEIAKAFTDLGLAKYLH
jgi:hypothetical protein